MKAPYGIPFRGKTVNPILAFLGGVLLFFVIAVVFGVAVMWLWNALMPDIFGLSQISYWQALGLVVLARVLFGGFGPQHKTHSHGHLGHGNALREKWLNMSEEERKEFIQRNHIHRMWEGRPDSRPNETATETEDNHE